ncbi:hypothetical protein [Azospirillum thiophilum]|uniref:hypothetical protein n=1 Tax=Azospirillum thiophilum TaxID=528244 RepID=UPI0011877336|nr:hypothetical protein [Azospirillum thiophilum]
MCRYPAVEDFPEAAELRQIFAMALANRERRQKLKIITNEGDTPVHFPSKRLFFYDIQATAAMNDNASR